MICTVSCSDPTWDLNLALGHVLDLAHKVRAYCRPDNVHVPEQAAVLTRGLDRIAGFCEQHAAELKQEQHIGRLRDAELLAEITWRH